MEGAVHHLDEAGRLVSVAIDDAVAARASDLHFEPHDDALVVRMRVDGVVRELRRVPKSGEEAVTRRLKSLARLDPEANGLPQTGAFSVLVGADAVQLRCTVIPTVRGEQIALRIVPDDERASALPDLGLAPAAEASLAAALDRTSGLVLVVGPPGSGKTTTAYTALDRLSSAERIVMTLEDPVERTLAGVDHVAVNGAGGPTFAQGQQAVLRAAPDVLLIGEIRDSETARAAIEGALGGVLVVSTLLATDAASSIGRLAELGVDRDLIANAVHLVVAQRLVRTLCEHCREQYTADEDVRALLGVSAGDKEPLLLYRSRGCPKCEQTGFVGRAAVFEVMPVADTLRDVVRTGTTKEITAAAGRQGMPVLARSAMRLARSGRTSLEEALAAVSDLIG